MADFDDDTSAGSRADRGAERGADRNGLPFPGVQQMRGIVLGAIEAAQVRGSAMVGPEHLLLAIASEPDSPAAAVLSEFGLDRERLEEALDDETARSLAVVGIQELSPDLLTATMRMTRPGWSSATREVFRRASFPGGRGRRRPTELDALYGVVTASVGTVPRVLEYAGIDRDALIGRVERERLAADDLESRAGHQGVSAQDRQALRREAMKRAQQERAAQQRAQRSRRFP